MANYNATLEPDIFYHIFSRATGHERLFIEADNYRYFLDRYHYHISPVAKTYAYCLLPNHFHFLIQVRSVDELKNHFATARGAMDPPEWPLILMRQFSNWLNGYAKAFNKKYNRRGSLFMDYMQRRKLILESERLVALYYIHRNPVKHNMTNKPDEWQWSSFLKCMSNSSQFELKETLSWFGSVDEYLICHQNL